MLTLLRADQVSIYQKDIFRLDPESSAKPHNDQILSKISFSISKGESFAITGHSGSGKSTLLRSLCRLEEADEGEIYYLEKPLRSYHANDLRRKICLVFQSPTMITNSIIDELSLGKNLSTLSHHNGKENMDPDIAQQLLNQVHLGELSLHQSPHKLSQGEAHRLSLARALALKPDILLLDEPTSSLDAKSKQVIEITVQELTLQGMTIILVSHDSAQIQRMTTHGIHLNHGKIERNW